MQIELSPFKVRSLFMGPYLRSLFIPPNFLQDLF